MKYLIFVILSVLLILTGCHVKNQTTVTTTLTTEERTSTTENTTTEDLGVTPTKEPILPSVISNNMIFQQHKPIRVWGKAESGVIINVKMIRDKDQEVIYSDKVTTGEDGNWLIEFPALEGSFDKYYFVISDLLHEITINDVVVGEVWVAGGQSNMDVELRYIINGRYYLNTANYEHTRIFYQKLTPFDNNNADFSYFPEFDVQDGQWVKAISGDNVANCSGIGYIFALTLYNELNVPVGIINTSKGGSSIHTWMSREIIDKTSEVKSYVQSIGAYKTPSTWNNWRNNKEFWQQNYNQATAMYNHKIAPLTNLNIKGFVWYQGENDCKVPGYYYYALSALIKDYSEKFRTENLPFAIIQLAPRSDITQDFYPDFLLTQHRVVKDHPETRAIIPIHDVDLTWNYGDYYDRQPVHPLDKVPVGTRAAKAMLTFIYNHEIDYLAPEYTHHELIGNEVHIYFNHADSGLQTKNSNKIKMLQVIKKDGSRVNVDGTVQGNKIIITYNNWDEIQFIAYGYAAMNHDANLFNALDVPVVPFKIKLV